MTAGYWCVIPAGGRGSRFGGDIPKQFIDVGGRSVLLHTLEALLSHPRIAGAVVALPAQGAPGADLPHAIHGKPVLPCAGGDSRADSVANALSTVPADVGDDDPVLVHDAARPNIAHHDLDALFDALAHHPQGAILAAPVRDTLKRANTNGDIAGTEPREGLWRAFTPQAFPRRALVDALAATAARGIDPTDEAMAMELAGVYAHLVEGRDDNFKITTPADLDRFTYLVSRR